MLALALAATLLFDPADQDKTAPRPMPVAVKPAAGPVVDNVPTAVAVTVECTAEANGQVSNCRVLGETHPGLGFGEAAVALMNDSEVEAGPEAIQFARTIQFTP